MNAATHYEQLGAYDVHQRQDEDNRDIDKRALLSCAARLKTALDDGGKDMKAYGDALRHNQRLWTIFQVALCDPENQLPKDLKLTLLNLSRYIDRTSLASVTQFTPRALTELIDINRIIAAGLAKKPVANAPIPAEPIGTISVMTTV